MNATNAIKNTIIIALSVATIVSVAQTVDARHDADNAPNYEHPATPKPPGSTPPSPGHKNG